MLLPYFDASKLEAGCDEAGRGCLAGPVVAAAVVLPKKVSIPLLNDSKKLSEKQRNQLRPIIEKQALSFAIGVVSPEEIDEINILNASFLAMHRAVKQLNPKPDHLLIDGNRFNPYPNINHTCIIKGDSKYMSIAAASVLAKTYRDEIMETLHKEFPQYGWNSNKGYPTSKHRDAIRKFGVSPHHRQSFSLLPKQLSLFE
ncbi:MAG: ribonuclease HII [Bacteroidetes bacterium]|nr:MAG: ribonuclease HII [Bacteroidota bacterium]